MAILKGSIIMISGLFILSLLENNNLTIINSVPIIGTLYGNKIKKYVKKNKSMALLVLITFIEVIL
jgi:hypothetical protein